MKVKSVKNLDDGVVFSKKLLYDCCNKNTVLFLSGGRTPAPLYKKLAEEKKLKVGALAMVDDRYSLHEQYSNEFMIRDSGLAQFIEGLGSAFFSILEYGLSLKKTAEKYDNDVRFLFSKFPKRVAILGIGSDGHIASLPAGIQNSKFKIQNYEYVTAIHNFPGEFKERISLTFTSLSMFDLLIVLVFGEEKKKAIEEMFKTGSTEEIPARFLVNSKVSNKVILVTDQNIIY